MRTIPIRRLLLWTVMLAAFGLPATPASGGSPAPVLTQHNNNSRTGAYLDETQLNTSNVNSALFGKLFTRAVDGQVYAQPLYVPGVAVAGGPRNVVYVATMHNSVYAFDADNPDAAQPLWHVNLGLSAPITYTLPNTTTVGHDLGPPGYINIAIEVGILSTPVIDPNSQTMYVMALNREPQPPSCPCQYAYRLHALDLATGSEKFGGPVVVTGSVPGTAADGANGIVSFLVRQQDQRTALLLQNGVIYMGFASYATNTPYHGWVFGYDAATLQQVSAWNSTPNSGLGGVWQAGQGMVADAGGKIYLMTGNGHFDKDTGDWGDSFIKLDPQGVLSGVLPVADSFTPFDQLQLETEDADLGAGGPLNIPGTSLLIGVSKKGKLYMVNMQDMGGYQEAPDNSDRIVQSFQSTPLNFYPLRGTPVFWNSANGPRLYLWGVGEGLTEFGLTITNSVSATIQTTPVATSTTTPTTALSGGFMSLSANGNNAGSGIVWAERAQTKPGYNNRQAVLYAFDADNVANELWNSEQVTARDAVGEWAKYTVPTIANGRVYMVNWSHQLVVYGIMGAPHFLAQPASQGVLYGQSAALTATVSGQPALSYQWYAGPRGDTQHPVGANSASFTTPPLAFTGSYWLRASNGLGRADSAAAVITVTAASTFFMPIINR